MSGKVRRGYFVDGLGAAQFAVPGRGRSDPRAAGGRPAAMSGRPCCSPPPTPPSRTAPRCRGPTGPGRPARQAGAFVVLVDGRAGGVPGAWRPQPADVRRRRRPNGPMRWRRSRRTGACGRSSSPGSTARLPTTRRSPTGSAPPGSPTAIAASRSGADCVPEGDTIHRTAAVLPRRCAREVVTGFEAPRALGGAPAPGPGERVLSGRSAREAPADPVRGRNHAAHPHAHDGLVAGPPCRRAAAGAAGGRPSPRSGRRARSAECVSAPVVELLDDHALRRHPVLSTLGPDLCLPDPDLDRVMGRLDQAGPFHAGRGGAPGPARRRRHRQRLQVRGRVRLFAWTRSCRSPSWTATSGSSSGEPRASCCGATSGPAPRRTVSARARGLRPRRASVPRCGTAIAVRRQGEAARPTWWCPTCQPRTRPDAPSDAR